MDYTVLKLDPKGIQKSFYHKAYVVKFNNGARFLYSYKTLVAYQLTNGSYHKVWDDWSVTTSNHLQAFGFGVCKKDWLSLKCEGVPKKYRIDLNRAYAYDISNTKYKANYWLY